MKLKIHRSGWIIITLALIKLIIHFLTNTNYELQRDAYLYLAMGEHLDFGYVSVPPSIAVVGAVMRFFFGDSVFAVRLAPALIGAISVVCIGLIVRELGGRTWAVAIACLAFITSPAFLRSNTLFQPVSFNQFYWLLSSYFIIKMMHKKNPKYWLIIFTIWGFAFLNKYSIVFFAFSIVIAILLTPARTIFISRYFWTGIGIGFLIALPNLIWQFSHNWPVVHHMLGLQSSQLVHVRISDFLTMQILMNLPQLIVWIPGLLLFLLAADQRHNQVLALAFFILLITFIVFHGKGYYTLGMYPVLFSAGGIAYEKFGTGRLQFLKYIPVPLMIFLTLPILPFSLPILKPAMMVEYGSVASGYGLEGALRWEDGRIYPLPQDYADMVGWEELAGIVIYTYRNLSESEQQQTLIFAENYGEAGAVKYFGKADHLPEPVSFSDSFIFWAPDSIRLTTLIYINDETEDVSFYFGEVKEVGRLTNPYAREGGMPVFLCRQPRNNFEQFYRDKVRRLKSVYDLN